MPAIAAIALTLAIRPPPPPPPPLATEQSDPPRESQLMAGGVTLITLGAISMVGAVPLVIIGTTNGVEPPYLAIGVAITLIASGIGMVAGGDFVLRTRSRRRSLTMTPDLVLHF